MTSNAREWRLALLLATALGCSGGGSSAATAGGGAASAASSGTVTIALGPVSTFATHDQLAANGFLWGPPDGTLGAWASGGAYTFFGSAHGSATCAGSPNAQGTFRFTGTLDRLTGLPAAQCKAAFTVGAAPSGWIFDRDYAGGGAVVPFQAGSATGLLMAYHGEVHWRNPAAADGLCNAVPCFYGGIGLAVSLDGGATFRSVGQIVQAYPPLSAYQGGSRNVGVGYGSLVVADASGHWLPAPPPDPASAYLYLFYEDYDPKGPAACANAACVAVARARLDEVLAAAVPPASSDPSAVAALFRKYDASAADPWSQRAASGDPTESTASGHFTPLFDDANGFLPSVIWDTAANAYLMVHQRFAGGAQPTSFVLRSSGDLLHWSSPLATYAPAAGHEPFYPTLVGETGNPLVGGAAPRLFFSTFDVFPDWPRSELDSLPVQVAVTP